jgi:hypothetical protein
MGIDKVLPPIYADRDDQERVLNAQGFLFASEFIFPGWPELFVFSGLLLYL